MCVTLVFLSCLPQELELRIGLYLKLRFGGRGEVPFAPFEADFFAGVRAEDIVFVLICVHGLQLKSDLGIRLFQKQAPSEVGTFSSKRLEVYLTSALELQ